MRHALVLDPADIKKLIAEKFEVEEKQIIKTQYSYIVTVADDDDEELAP